MRMCNGLDSIETNIYKAHTYRDGTLNYPQDFPEAKRLYPSIFREEDIGEER